MSCSAGCSCNGKGCGNLSETPAVSGCSSNGHCSCSPLSSDSTAPADWKICEPSRTSSNLFHVKTMDPDWVDAWQSLVALHHEKSSTYGKQADRLWNFTSLGQAAGQPPEYFAIARVVEKCVRALNMMDAGLADQVKEYPDIASLGLVAEALRRRRG